MDKSIKRILSLCVTLILVIGNFYILFSAAAYTYSKDFGDLTVSSDDVDVADLNNVAPNYTAVDIKVDGSYHIYESRGGKSL